MATKDEYYKEKALAKLLDLFEAQERVTAIYADILMHYPNAADLLDKNDPSLAALRKEAGERWEQHQKQQPQ
jgi:hypothetical protein